MLKFESIEFENDLERLINHEGGWHVTDDPDDPDLATFAGVRYISYVQWCKNNGLAFMPLNDFKTVDPKHPFLREAIAHIYYDDYYTKSGAAELKHEPVIRYMVFSAAVNHGCSPVVKMIQRLVNKKHKNILTVDGQFGLYTKKILNQYIINNDEEEFIFDFMHQWLLYYGGIVQRNADKWWKYAEGLEKVINFNNLSHPFATRPKYRQYKFLKGWINRVFKAL